MFKLLRKYDKWILAIGGSLLMVVFLLPQALTQFGSGPQNATAAIIDGGKKISEKQRSDALREIAILNSLSPLITASMLQIGGETDDPENDMGEGLHWMLLTQDAQADGLVGGPQDGRDFIPVAAKFFARQYVLQNRFSINIDQLADTEAQLGQTYASQLEASRSDFINRTGTPPVMVDRTLAKARGVLRMYEAYLAFDLPAIQESLELCHRYFDSAEVLFYTVGSDAFIDPAYEPDETEILVQYGKNKDFLPGEGEFGFGYRNEDRVRIEWLRIARQEIADAIIVDPIDANTRWRANRTQYPGDFAQERDKVEMDIRIDRTDSILREAEQFVRAELLKGRGALTQNPDGTYDLPNDWEQTRPRFISVAQRVGDRLRAKHGPEMPNPSTLDDLGQWRTRIMVQGIPIIGKASKLIGPRSVPMADLAFSVPEITPDAVYPVQTGITQGPLVAAGTGDVVFFRVVKAEASAPRPLAEARNDVIEDIRKLRAYEALKAEAPRMISQIISLGVDEAAEARGVRLNREVRVQKDRVSPIDPATSPPTFEIQKIDNETFRDAVMARADSFPINQPLSRLENRDLLLSVPLDSRREVAIVGITSVIPLTLEAFRMIESEALQYNRMRQQNIDALKAWPYSMNQMQVRHDVKIIRNTDPDDAEETLDELDEAAPVAEADAEKSDD